MIYSAQEERREGKINLNYLRDLRRFIHSRSFSLLFFLHCHSLSLCLCLRNSLLSGERTKFQRAKSEREGGRDISALIGSGCRKRSNVWSETRTHREKEYTCCVRVQHRWSSLSDFSNFFLSFLLLRVLELKSQFLKISRPIFPRVDHFEPFLVHSFPLCSLSLLYRASARRCIVTLSASLFLARRAERGRCRKTSKAGGKIYFRAVNDSIGIQISVSLYLEYAKERNRWRKTHPTLCPRKSATRRSRWGRSCSRTSRPGWTGSCLEPTVMSIVWEQEIIGYENNNV